MHAEGSLSKGGAAVTGCQATIVSTGADWVNRPYGVCSGCVESRGEPVRGHYLRGSPTVFGNLKNDKVTKMYLVSGVLVASSAG